MVCLTLHSVEILSLIFKRLSKYTLGMPAFLKISSYLPVKCLCQHLQVSRGHALTVTKSLSVYLG